MIGEQTHFNWHGDKKGTAIMITLRALTEEDIPNLTHIRPTFKSPTILQIEHNNGTDGIEMGWRLVEQPVMPPYDRGSAFDFDEYAQEAIRERLARVADGETYQRVAEFEGRLIGLVEVEIQDWNNSAHLLTLMIDLDFRGQGLGRRLWHRAVDFARQSDVRAILIETQNTNVAACRFYARLGCRLAGLHEAYYDEPTAEVALFWSYPIHTRKNPAVPRLIKT